MGKKKVKILAITKEDWIKIAKGLGIAVAGAAMTYVEQLLPMLEFGEYTPIVMAVNCVIVNIIRKYSL